MKFCQFDEEALIAPFVKSKGLCAEFGARGRRGSNVAHLLDSGWRCQLIDKNINTTIKDFPINGMRREFRTYGSVYYGDAEHEIVHATVTPENVNQILWPDLKVLSIDVDGRDFEIFQAITQRPEVVIIECNDISSKQQIRDYGEGIGYRYVGKTGVNVILHYETELRSPT